MLKRIYRRLTQLSLPGISMACLMFHRIAEVKEEIGPYPAITISPAAFEAIIAFFSQNFRATSLPDLGKNLAEGKTPPSNTFAVTFDDGFVDTWSVAKPILEKYEVPATVYVTTGYTDGEAFPYEFALADLLGTRDEVHFHWDGREYQWKLKNTQDREQCYTAIKQMGKPLPYDLRTELVARVYGESQSPHFKNSLFMNWQQVSDLSRSPLFTIGAHTHRHILLPCHSPEDVQKEIMYSKHRLEDNLGIPIYHFSYPYGASTPSIQSQVRQCGFTSAVGGKPGGINPRSVDLFTIPRVELRALPSATQNTISKVIQACGYS